MPEREETAGAEHPVDEPDPEREHRACGRRIDDTRAHDTQLVAVVHQRRSAGREDVAAPVRVCAVDQADDETLAGLLSEHRRVVGAPAPAAYVLHDPDRTRAGDAEDGRVEESA